ncbi:beta-N-acetylhexosaminidase [Flavisolibacter tropicus]|nr:family 20 glycosylhydrolase [Flavisolibacter tropicus]
MFRTLTKIVCMLGSVWLPMQGFSQLNIIPQPAEVIISSAPDSFAITSKTVLVVEQPELQPSADFFNNYLKEVYGFTLKTSKKAVANNAIVLSRSKEDGSVSGAYHMSIGKETITIKANDESGVFYGMQTLVQVLPVQKSLSLNMPQAQINDAPRYQYRGMHLDVARHFYPVDFVKKYIDYLALHKMNVFHWHLTDDQGWRIEIKKYPKLAEVAAYRDGTIIGHFPGTGNDGKRYGGFYTQKEIKEVVQYAAKRYITIIPEIEMPGHASAALTAYPALGCSGGPYKVQQTWGVFNEVYCAGNDSVFAFLQDVIDEVLPLFPSKVIHIGGDECPKESWKKCVRCQQRKKENNLKDEHELQSYFVQRMEKYLNSKGRTLMGWDEILEGGLAPNAVVMSWRGEKGGIEAAKQKHEVIMTPNSPLYFDHYQGKASEEPLAIGGYNTLEKVYAYNPTPKELSAEEGVYIKGVQANIWTEYIPTTQQVEYMLMPRLAALSEVAWTQPSQKSWDGFKQRMETQYQRYSALGVNYAKSAYDVRPTVLLETAASKATVTFATDSYTSQIYYTLDGSEPTMNAKKYTKPFEVRKSVTIKAASFNEGKQLGKTSSQQVILN